MVEVTTTALITGEGVKIPVEAPMVREVVEVATKGEVLTTIIGLELGVQAATAAAISLHGQQEEVVVGRMMATVDGTE